MFISGSLLEYLLSLTLLNTCLYHSLLTLNYLLPVLYNQRLYPPNKFSTLPIHSPLYSLSLESHFTNIAFLSTLLDTRLQQKTVGKRNTQLTILNSITIPLKKFATTAKYQTLSTLLCSVGATWRLPWVAPNSRASETICG